MNLEISTGLQFTLWSTFVQRLALGRIYRQTKHGRYSKLN